MKFPIKKAIFSGLAVLSVLAGALVAGVPAAMAANPASISIPNQAVPNTAGFDVSIQVNSGTVLNSGAQADVSFDSSVLHANSVTYTSYYGTGSAIYTVTPVITNPTASPFSGLVHNIVIANVASQTFSGTGTFATINFTPLQSNVQTTLHLLGDHTHTTLVADPDGNTIPTDYNDSVITIGTIAAPDLAPINVVANGTTANYTVSFSVQNLGALASAASTANIFIDGSTTPATTPINVPSVPANSTGGVLTSSSITISGTSDSIVVTVVPVTGETNTSNNSSTPPAHYSYQPPPPGAIIAPVIVEGNIGLTFNFTPPSAISFGTMHVGVNPQTDTNMNVTSNEAWQITVQGLAPSTTTSSGYDGKMTKWLPPVAPATVGTYTPAVKLHAPLQIGANTPTSSGTVALDGTVQTLGSGTPETQHTDGSGLTMTTTFTQNISYSDYALTNGYNYHIVVNFICTPTLY